MIQVSVTILSLNMLQHYGVFLLKKYFISGQLTWLVYIIGSAVGGRVSFNSNEEHDTMDGELVYRVLQLMNLTDSRLVQGGCEKLELAMLSFFDQFRKIYVGDQVQKNSKVYRRLSEALGLNDEATVLSVFIRKMYVKPFINYLTFLLITNIFIFQYNEFKILGSQ